MATPTIISANPGNLVVPLSAIIDQLQGKLSAADLNALLLAVVAPRKNEVRPGDLITADLFNQLLSDLADLQRRVAQLEGAVVGDETLRIDKVLPQVLRMGEELRVFGSGLSVSQLKSVSIEGTVVPLTALSGSSTLLILTVPPILGIPDAGKTVVLTVENKVGMSDFASFLLLPGVATNLEASFKITRTTVSPNEPLVKNKAYEYTYSIEAFSSRDEDYVLEPTIAGAPNDWSVKMKTPQSDLRIPKSQPTPSSTSVVVVLTTGAAGGGQLALGLRAKNFAGVSGSSMAEAVSIGVQNQPPNLDVAFLTPVVLGNVQKFTNGTLYVRTDANPNNQLAKINPLNVQLRLDGIYDIGVPIVSDAKWSVAVTNNPMQFNTAGLPNAIKAITFEVRASAGAPDATVRIPVTGQGALPHGEFTFAVKLRANPSQPTPP